MQVSLFTREWIEIDSNMLKSHSEICLPLYEGVDWNAVRKLEILSEVRLPLYEGVDWNCWDDFGTTSGLSSPSLRGSGLKCCFCPLMYCINCLPLYEGVDWNFRKFRRLYQIRGLPLYEGVDWNACQNGITTNPTAVSLFTREWIEIFFDSKTFYPHQCLPLYEGVDWNQYGGLTPYRMIGVSLFTREWIEIFAMNAIQTPSLSLPLYEGVDWNCSSHLINFNQHSLPLYEGVDWNPDVEMRRKLGFGLPLYEGVDWNSVISPLSDFTSNVSLFTREWIEIHYGRDCARNRVPKSPSLRGSGLKSPLPQRGSPSKHRLPLYEGVDWNSVISPLSDFTSNVSLFTREWIEITLTGVIHSDICSLPLYEGVDWNRTCCPGNGCNLGLPLYEGVDWNRGNRMSKLIIYRLPLYEGVDWNILAVAVNTQQKRSPSLRGSGLKYPNEIFSCKFSVSPSLRGSGLKSLADWIYMHHVFCLPLYEGVDWNTLTSVNRCRIKHVSLFTREWIEISHIQEPSKPLLCLPLYEGVDWNKQAWQT